jgi:putative transcriptional regulator
MPLGNDLKRCRFEQGDMSQDSLAKAVGVTRQTIISIEKGRFVPSTLLALKLARFFGRPVEQIFRIEEDGPTEGEKRHAIGN